MTSCSEPDCDRPVKARDRCQRHYMQLFRAGGVSGACAAVDCDLPVYALGLCRSHGASSAAPPRKYRCDWKGCRARAEAYGRCAKHPRRKPPTAPPTARPRKKAAAPRICAITTCERQVQAFGLCNHHRQYVHNYRLTIEEIEEVERWRREEKPCDVCRERPGVHIDHDHTGQTGRTCEREAVRGWLCGSCNHLIGYSRDSAEVLRAAADYLDQAGPAGLLIV